MQGTDGGTCGGLQSISRHAQVSSTKTRGKDLPDYCTKRVPINQPKNSYNDKSVREISFIANSYIGMV